MNEASLFAILFKWLAKEPTPRNKRFARKLWRASISWDFNAWDMDCDRALKKLGLCKFFGTNEDGGEVRVWGYGNYKWDPFHHEA